MSCCLFHSETSHFPLNLYPRINAACIASDAGTCRDFDTLNTDFRDLLNELQVERRNTTLGRVLLAHYQYTLPPRGLAGLQGVRGLPIPKRKPQVGPQSRRFPSSSRASGMEAAEVLPYSSKLQRIFSFCQAPDLGGFEVQILTSPSNSEARAVGLRKHSLVPFSINREHKQCTAVSHPSLIPRSGTGLGFELWLSTI